MHNRVAFNTSSYVTRTYLRAEIVEVILDEVHPSNLEPLPPSPALIALKALQLGLVKEYRQAFTEITVWRKHWSDKTDQEVQQRISTMYNR